jgi:hypothetical protein
MRRCTFSSRSLAFGNVRNSADHTHGPLFATDVLEISKAQSLYPADLTVSRWSRTSVADRFGLTGSSLASSAVKTLSTSSGCTSL